MKKKNVLIFLLSSLLVVLSFILFILINDYKKTDISHEKPIVFEDNIFEKSLKKALGKDDKDRVYPSELISYTGIVIVANRIFLVNPDVTEKNVSLYRGETFEIDTTIYTEEGTMTSLADLQYFSNLTSLKVYFQKNIDYNTIGLSSTINNLFLYADNLTDLTFIERFINLTYLSLDYNQIDNLASLGKLPKLKTAIINFNNISNIVGIENDISLVNLQLNNNKITDISLLSNLTSLTYLSLQYNNISDISPIKNLTNLQNLYIKDNPILNIELLNTFPIIFE
jgi:internalin A